MYGLSVLTWGTGLGVSQYLSAATGEFFHGGNAGHAALSLTIPDTEENRKLITEANREGKLKVSYKNITVTERVDTPPYFRAKTEKAIEIYFSFWGDPKTKPSPERHLMVDFTGDLLGEAESDTDKYPLRFPLMPGQEALKEKLSEELKSKRKEKQQVLSHVKYISKLLLGKTEEEKAQILAKQDVKDILKLEGVGTFKDLQKKLGVVSAGLKEFYSLIESIGGIFGKLPDSVVHLPVDAIGTSAPAFALDYKAVLKKMAEIANNPNPYKLLSQNCSTTAHRCIQAGVTPTLQEQLTQSGTRMQSAGVKMLFATPQGVMLYASKLQSDLMSANVADDKFPAEKGEHKPKAEEAQEEAAWAEKKATPAKSFASRVYAFVADTIDKVFRPTKVLEKQCNELKQLIAATKQDITILNKSLTNQKLNATAKIFVEKMLCGGLQENLKKYNAALAEVEKKLSVNTKKKEDEEPKSAMKP